MTAWQTVPHETSSPAWPNFHRDNRGRSNRSELVFISQAAIAHERENLNDAVAYFWEVMGQEDGSRGVHVNIGTPNPITSTCERDEEEP